MAADIVVGKQKPDSSAEIGIEIKETQINQYNRFAA